MHLFNVRRGQFVYFENQLHQVYSVKPFFKHSVHLIRLQDFTQQLSTAREIDLYKPKHLDSFTFNHTTYTLDKDKRAETGDYILVTNPNPDSIDNHHLHAIEMVASVESNGIISTKANGIKHREYWVMIPEVLDAAKNIDLQDPSLATSDSDEQLPTKTTLKEVKMPFIGDVFHNTAYDPPMKTMVVAVQDETVYFGGNLNATKHELADTEKWQFVYSIFDE